MTGIDIRLFEFDRHNALYYFIMNADEHIYMRYGGRDATSPHTYLDLESLEIALQLGLEQHELYNQGKSEKQERPARLLPREIPLLRNEVSRFRRCVECHMISDFQTQQLELTGKLNKLQDMYVFPDIERIGIHLDIPRGLVVKKARSAVKQAGMQPNDLIVEINGTPVLTFGDLQHFFDKVSRDTRQMSISVVRNGEKKDLVIDLPREWWWTDLTHRYWSVEPILFFSLRLLSDEEKRDHNLELRGFASEVTWVYADAGELGLGNLLLGDIIYSVDGVDVNELTQSCETHIKLNVSAGAYFTAELLRNGEKMEMRLRTVRQNFRK